VASLGVQRFVLLTRASRLDAEGLLVTTAPGEPGGLG
jgi:hypothetical protein